MRKIIKETFRRDLFIRKKYPADVDIENFVHRVLVNCFPEVRMYKDKDNWEQVWYKLRGVPLELFRTTRGNAIRQIKYSLFQKFRNLEEINHDATINQILEWKDNDSTKETLDSLCEIEEDDDMTFFENITREAFSGNRGKVNGTNKKFCMGIIKCFSWHRK
ncbi:7738_t:CDS:2 [Entrophospora sp. SA101]|nr:7738_t:CDS:2 [Entrophospora sp. SA101]